MAEDVEPFYRVRAKEVTDMLFDKRFLADDLSRESVDKLQDFLGFLFQSQAESAVRSAELIAKFRDARTSPPKTGDEHGDVFENIN